MGSAGQDRDLGGWGRPDALQPSEGETACSRWAYSTLGLSCATCLPRRAQMYHDLRVRDVLRCQRCTAPQG